MDKLEKVWTKLSTSRRLSQTRLNDIDDENAPSDTKKVFEMFAENPRSMEHRHSNAAGGSARTATTHRKNQSLTGREMPARIAPHATKLPEATVLKEETDHQKRSSSISADAGSRATIANTSTTRSLPNETVAKNVDSSVLISRYYRDVPVVAMDAEVVDITQPLSTGGNSSASASFRKSPTPTSKSTVVCTSSSLPKNYGETASFSQSGMNASSRVTFTLPSSNISEIVDNTEGDIDQRRHDSISREHLYEQSTAYDIVETSKKADDFLLDSTSSGSVNDFRQQAKRRSSMFVRRGSVIMEPLKRIVLDDVYKVYKQLGTGRFGCIKLAEHKESKHNIAIKFFPRPQVKQVDFIREYNYSYFLSPHPNIIDTYRGTYQTDDESAYFFVQEFCPCASLREAVEASSSGIGEYITKTVMLKVLAAVEFMHIENLVHRNLKAENILIFDRDYNKVKVTDFGLTRKVGSLVRHLEYINSYHAPELCETVVNETFVVDRSIDIWAIGILIYYCLKGRFPWQKATIMCKPYWEWEQWLKRKNLQLPKRWDSFSEKSLKLFRRTLEPRQKDRWSVKNVSKCLMKEKLMKMPKVTEEV